MKTFRTDLFDEEVHVFTPKGQVKTLPAGSTPIDFAYAVHTDVGHHTVGAKVNGRIVPLHYRLKNGDFVEILTSKQERGPSRDWLSLAKSSRARNKIRQWFTRETREDQEAKGRESLEHALKQQNLPYAKLRHSAVLAQVIRDLGFKKAEDFYLALGSGRLQSGAIVNKVIQRLKTEEVAEEAPIVTKTPKARSAVSGSEVGVVVEGVEDVLVRLAKCCTPVPGDPIVGYISLGKGITIHREDCPNVQALMRNEERFTPVEWSGDGTKSFRVQIAVTSWDRPRLLEDVARTFAEHGANIVSYGGVVEDQLAKNWYTAEMGDVHVAPLAARRAARGRRGVRRLPRHADLSQLVPGDAAGVPADEAVRRDARTATRSSERAGRRSRRRRARRRGCPRRRPAPGLAASGAGVPGLRAEHELAALDEEDPGPAAAAAGRRGRATTRAEDVVGVAAAVDDPVDLLERRRFRSQLRALELGARCARKLSGTGSVLPVVVVDQHVHLGRGHHQRAPRRPAEPVGGVLVGDARAADPGDADEHLEQVVEARRRVVLDVRGAHHELGPPGADLAEPPVVLGARQVEVGQIAAVVDDALRVGVRERHPRVDREPKRRLPSSDAGSNTAILAAPRLRCQHRHECASSCQSENSPSVRLVVKRLQSACLDAAIVEPEASTTSRREETTARIFLDDSDREGRPLDRASGVRLGASATA